MATGIRNNSFYRLGNKASGKALNHYAPGGSNVNVYAEDGSADQVWHYVSNRLYPESNPSKCLDRYYASDNPNNADVYAPNDPDNQLLTFSRVSTSDYGYYYHIKVNGYYLTQVGSDVKWTPSASGDSSVWLAEELICVTGIPTSSGATTKDYFAVWSGFTNGTFSKSSSITNLYNKCFKTTGNNGQKYYNMYGCIFSAARPASYKGKFHSGIDLSPGRGTPVTAPISGVVVYSSLTDYGTVTVKENSTNRLFLFMHMTDLIQKGATVTVNKTVLGYVGGTGKGGTDEFDPHLHVEVHPAGKNNYGDAYQVNSFNNLGDSIPVHNYF